MAKTRTLDEGDQQHDEPESLRGSALKMMQSVQSMLDRIPAQAWLREEHLAHRMTEERKRRKWSQERLAQEMKNHGFALAQSSISKIENPAYGTPRRAISVDEAVGLAVVFEIPLLRLLAPVGTYGAAAVEAMVDGAKLAEAATAAQSALDAAVDLVASEYVNNTDGFGPVLASQVNRMCASLGVAFGPGVERRLLAIRPESVDVPVRHELTFIQSVLRAAEATRPKRGRGPRAAKSPPKESS